MSTRERFSIQPPPPRPPAWVLLKLLYYPRDSLLEFYYICRCRIPNPWAAAACAAAYDRDARLHRKLGVIIHTIVAERKLTRCAARFPLHVHGAGAHAPEVETSSELWLLGTGGSAAPSRLSGCKIARSSGCSLSLPRSRGAAHHGVTILIPAYLFLFDVLRLFGTPHLNMTRINSWLEPRRS